MLNIGTLVLKMIVAMSYYTTMLKLKTTKVLDELLNACTSAQ
jgi:hypothetical protein